MKAEVWEVRGGLREAMETRGGGASSRGSCEGTHRGGRRLEREGLEETFCCIGRRKGPWRTQTVSGCRGGLGGSKVQTASGGAVKTGTPEADGRGEGRLFCKKLEGAGRGSR